MGAYSVSFTGIGAVSGAPLATLHTGSNPIKLMKFGLFNTTSLATSFGLFRPNNTPVATTSILGQALASTAPASTTSVDTTWSTAPTIGANVALTGIILPGTIAAGFVDVWRPDRPLEVAANSWLVVWNFSASTVAVPRIMFEWDE